MKTKVQFLDLGKQPITNNFLTKKNPKNEFFYSLRLIFHKKIVFGIKTSHLSKYDQHIRDRVGPVTRGIFTGRKNSEIIETLVVVSMWSYPLFCSSRKIFYTSY